MEDIYQSSMSAIDIRCIKLRLFLAIVQIEKNVFLSTKYKINLSPMYIIFIIKL